MDLKTRIERRRRRTEPAEPVRDYGLLAPLTHVAEPASCGPLLERLLDHLDPAFDGRLPPNAYLHGPTGTGKSAVTTALFDRLSHLASSQDQLIHTATRVEARRLPAFVYLDARHATSEFAFYHHLLDRLSDEHVPRQGVGTATLRDRLDAILSETTPGLVVAVDHVGEPETFDAEQLLALASPLPGSARWLAVGTRPPHETSLGDLGTRTIGVDPYSRQKLVDLLTARTAEGLWPPGLDHEDVDRIAAWADGNAHDGLTVAFVAADHADRAGSTAVERAHVDAAVESVPDQLLPIGRVFALPDNQQAVLRELVDLDSEERASVTGATEAIAATHLDLSQGTIQRFLYELAERDVLARVEREPRRQRGRPPSRIEPQFSTVVFRRLYDG